MNQVQQKLNFQIDSEEKQRQQDIQQEDKEIQETEDNQANYSPQAQSEKQYQEYYQNSPDTLLTKEEIQYLDQLTQKKPISQNASQNISQNISKMDQFPDDIPRFARLYYYGLQKIEKNKIFQAKIENERQYLANSMKMTEKTYQILKKKLEKEISMGIVEVCQDNNQMTFENMGRIFTILEVFKIIQYDENSNFINNEPNDNDSVTDNERKFKEMCVHEKFWQLLESEENQESVANELVWCILRILLDPIKLPQNQRCKIIQEYLEKFKEIQVPIDDIKVFMSLWTDLQSSNLAYKKIGFLKPQKFDEYIQHQTKTLTFQPKINEINYLIEQQSTAQFLEKNPIEGVSSPMHEKSQSQNKSQLSHSRSQTQGESKIQKFDDRIKILYKKQELSQQKKFFQQKNKENEIKKQCTFQPDLSKNNKINEWASRSKYNGKQDIYQRLYQFKSTQEKEEQAQRRKEELEQLELEKCSFQPITNMEIPLTSQGHVNVQVANMVRGYEEQIGRMKNAQEKQQKQKELIEEIPRGENYEYMRSKKFNPPSFLQREKPEKRLPFYYIDVNIGNGKRGKIALYEGDDPYQVARNFAIAFQLTADMEEDLVNLLQQQMDEHEKQKQNQ